jgi:hypothetical protein
MKENIRGFLAVLPKPTEETTEEKSWRKGVPAKKTVVPGILALEHSVYQVVRHNAKIRLYHLDGFPVGLFSFA